MRKGLLFAMLLFGYAYLAGRQVAMLLVFPSFAQERPYLTIASPQEGETIFGDQVVFSFFTSNFLLGMDGYVRVFLDQEKPLIIQTQKETPLRGLSQEKHILIAELIDKKNQSLSPPVEKEVNFWSVLPKKEEEVISLEIAPVETKNTPSFFPLSFGLLALIGTTSLALAFKLYINAKTGQNRSDQKPLG